MTDDDINPKIEQMRLIHQLNAEINKTEQLSSPETLALYRKRFAPVLDHVDDDGVYENLISALTDGLVTPKFDSDRIVGFVITDINGDGGPP